MQELEVGLRSEQYLLVISKVKTDILIITSSSTSALSPRVQPLLSRLCSHTLFYHLFLLPSLPCYILQKTFVFFVISDINNGIIKPGTATTTKKALFWHKGQNKILGPSPPRELEAGFQIRPHFLDPVKVEFTIETYCHTKTRYSWGSSTCTDVSELLTRKLGS